MRKRLLSLVAALVLTCSLVPGIALADEGGGEPVAVTIEIGADGAPVGTSGNGWAYENGELTLEAGYAFTFAGGTFGASGEGRILNSGTIVDGTFASSVDNAGFIDGGTFSDYVRNDRSGTVSGGVFNDGGNNNSLDNSGTVTGGDFNVGVQNAGTIEGTGAFSASVQNRGSGTIANGMFDGELFNQGTIAGGTFKGTVTNDGTIEGGRFWQVIDDDDGTVTACDYLVELRLENLTSTANVADDGKVYLPYRMDGSGGLAFELALSSNAPAGYELPRQLQVERGGVMLTEGYAYERAVGTVAILNEAATGPLVVTAAAQPKAEEIVIGEDGKPASDAGEKWTYDAGTATLRLEQGGTFALEGKPFGGTIENAGTLIGGEAKTVTNSGTIAGGTFTIATNNEGGLISGGTFKAVVLNKGGTIVGATFNCKVENKAGVLEDGTFNKAVSNSGTIAGGAFAGSGIVSNKSTGTITGGRFTCRVENNGTIEEGTFDGEVSNYGAVPSTPDAGGAIKGGTFSGSVSNSGAIAGGTFAGTWTNEESGTIAGGEFVGKGTFQNHGAIENGAFADTCTVFSTGLIKGGAFGGNVANIDISNVTGNGFGDGGIIENGTFGFGVINVGRIKGGTFAEESIVMNGMADVAMERSEPRLDVANIADVENVANGSGIIEGTIEDGAFYGSVINCSIVDGGFFAHAIANEGGTLNACTYPLTATLAGLSLEVVGIDSPTAAFKVGSDEPNRYTLTANKGYALPDGIELSCETVDGTVPVASTDYAYDVTSGAITIKKGAVAGPLTLVANGIPAPKPTPPTEPEEPTPPASEAKPLASTGDSALPQIVANIALLAAGTLAACAAVRRKRRSPRS